MDEGWLGNYYDEIVVWDCSIQMLAANIIAGHLLLTLLGNTGPFLSASLLSILIITQIALLVLESAVAIIQSYVFAVLSTLYSREVN